jgi:hypothetical protein
MEVTYYILVDGKHVQTSTTDTAIKTLTSCLWDFQSKDVMSYEIGEWVKYAIVCPSMRLVFEQRAQRTSATEFLHASMSSWKESTPGYYEFMKSLPGSVLTMLLIERVNQHEELLDAAFGLVATTHFSGCIDGATWDARNDLERVVNRQRGKTTSTANPPVKVDEVSSWDIDDDKYPRSDWKYEVNNGDTQLGYHEWLMHMREAREDMI